MLGFQGDVPFKAWKHVNDKVKKSTAEDMLETLDEMKTVCNAAVLLKM